MSYRYVWNYIQEIQTVMEEQIVDTYKGGKSGGGGAKLTDLGRSLLGEYKQAEVYLDKVLSNPKWFGGESFEVKCTQPI